MPFFSVIIPNYNRAHLIERTIQDVLDQSFPDFEIIVVDDGSTDNSKEVLVKYSSNEKVKVVFRENGGVCAARNTGALQAKGEFITFLDSDDAVENTWLEDFYNLKDGGFNILFCNMKLVKTNGKEEFYHSSDPYKNGRAKGVFTAGAWAVQKDVFFQAGMFDENIRFGENIELSYRLEKCGLKKGITDKFNFIYFESPDGGSKNLQNKIDSNIYIVNKHFDYFKSNSRLLLIYYQNIGVALAKTKQFDKARDYFWKAYQIDFKTKNLLRYLISFFPILAKKQWKLK